MNTVQRTEYYVEDEQDSWTSHENVASNGG